MFELLQKEIKDNANEEQAKHLEKYFKIKENNDVFLGLTSPVIKTIAKKYKDLNFNDINKLLKSKYHEERAVALTILINLYSSKNSNKKEILDIYMNNLDSVNNWDLVDTTCYKILGDYLYNYNNKDYTILKDFAKTNNLWKKRISIVSTMTFIKNNNFVPTLKIAKILLKDKNDLIQKATGWLLREIDKKDNKVLMEFLIDNIQDISNTTLRYATEKFSQNDLNKIKLIKQVINYERPIDISSLSFL